MKKSEVFGLAWHNLRTFKKSRQQYFVSIFMVTFFLMLFISISLIIQHSYNEIVYNMLSTNNVSLFYTLDSNGKEVSQNSDELRKLLEDYQDVTAGAKYGQINISATDTERYSEDISNVTCNVNGKNYIGQNDYSFDFVETKKISNKENKELFSVAFSIGSIDLASNMYNQNIKREYDYKYNTDIFLCGRFMETENEMIISDYMLKRFGINDYEAVLNQKISFYINGDLVIDEYTIVGIVNSNYYRVISNSDKSQVIISGTPKIYSQHKVTELIQEVGLGEFANSNKILNSIDDKYEDCYSATLNISTYELVDKFKLVCERMVGVFIAIIIIAMLVKLISNVYVNRKNRACYYGILKAMGMNNKVVIQICIYELVLILFFCMLLSIVLTLVILKIIQYMIAQMAGYYIMIPAITVISAIVITGITICFIVIVISIILNADIMHRPIIRIIDT